jgi:hypothetical protein
MQDAELPPGIRAEEWTATPIAVRVLVMELLRLIRTGCHAAQMAEITGDIGNFQSG